MMKKPSIDEMLSGKKSRYSLVMGVAKLSREISSQAEKEGRVIVEKPVNLAIKEFKDHKYEILEPEINN